MLLGYLTHTDCQVKVSSPSAPCLSDSLNGFSVLTVNHLGPNMGVVD